MLLEKAQTVTNGMRIDHRRSLILILIPPNQTIRTIPPLKNLD